MFLAALWSRLATYPHEGQTCVLTESDFSTTSPHFEQICEVNCGATLYTLQKGASDAVRGSDTGGIQKPCAYHYVELQ
jgi:hypothetical protein